MCCLNHLLYEIYLLNFYRYEVGVALRKVHDDDSDYVLTTASI